MCARLTIAEDLLMIVPVLDLGALRNALKSLEDSQEVVGDSKWFDQQSEKIQNTLTAGVIQNFEFVYEISTKMIRRQIELEAASPTEVDQSNFRDLIRVAAEKGIVTDAEAWFTYRRMRNLTSHTYDRQKAQQVYRETLAFVQDARSLLARLEARNG